MSAELQERQRAIQLRLAHHTVQSICTKLQHSKDWFYRWWHRYQDRGAEGICEQSHAPHSSPHRITDEIREAILAIRERLRRRRGPQARYRFAGAPTIQHELEVLGYTPLPSLRSIERILQQNHRTCAPFRTQPLCRASDYPGPKAQASNEVHQLDLVGPRYLTGSAVRYYVLVYKDTYDQAVFLDFQPEPDLDALLAFLVRAWQHLGLPRYLQVDNGRLFEGTGRWAGSLNRFIRLTLLVGVTPVFIPEGEPCHNGSVENFNGWFQERLFAIRLAGPAHVRRELAVLMDICYREHIHPQLGFRTTQQVRQSLHARHLPADFQKHQHRLAVAAGKIIFLRRVRASGRITLLAVKVHVSKRLRGRFVKAVLYTRTQTLKVHAGRKLVKSVPYPLRGVSN